MKQILASILLLSCLFINAQNVSIYDSITLKPIPEVAVFNEDKSISQVSNANGVIDLSLFSNKKVLVVKHLSYQELLIYKSDIVNNKIFLTSYLQGLDEIVLSASKFNENKSDVTKSITSISAKAIGFTNPQTSADALEATGKVYIQKSQLGGGSPIIRGFSTNRLLINVDGVRMNNAIFRSGNLQNVISIDPFTIKNTEVTLGPGTLIYGSDAIGGVMSFNTLKPKLSFQDSTIIDASSTVRYASASQEKTIHSNLNIGLKKWAFLSSFSFSDFSDLRMGKNGPDDYLRPEYVITNATTDYIQENKTPLIQRETGYTQSNFMQKVLFTPNSNLDLNLGVFYTKTSDVPRYDRLLRYRDDTLRSAEWFYGPQQWLMTHLSADYRKSNNWLYNNAKINIAYQKFDESRNDRDFQELIRNTRKEHVNAYSFNIDLEKIFNSKLKLFYGAEYVFNKVHSSAHKQNIETGIRNSIVTRYPNGATWQSIATYFNLKYKPIETLTLESGLRYNNVSSKASFKENNIFLNLPYTQTSNNNDAVTGSFGLSWLANKNLQWKFNMSSAFRAPNIDDIGKVFDSEPGNVVLPNEDLKPEYAIGGELAATLNFDNNVIFDLATYYTYLDDALVRRDDDLNGSSQIIYDGELSNIQSIQNASEAKIYGFEIGARFNFNKHFYSQSQFNVIGGKEITNNTETPTRHVSPQFGNSHLVWFNKKLKLDAFANFNGELSHNQLAISERDKEFIYALDDNGKPYAPSWYTLNFTSQYQLNKNTTITASIENITDQRYRTYSSGITASGRNLIIALKYNL
jgi:hemoglobin/transferrin/lactoferrin receptor protein